MFGEEFLHRAIIYGPVILFSLTIHEFFHAWSAHKFGDDTAKNLGRMSLNPLVHLDLFGSMVMVLSQFMFGWAKPVPVNPANLRNPRVADIWISAAGPLSNLGLALIAGILFQMTGGSGGGQADGVTQFFVAAVFINLALAFFNMIPLFPLDGSHILKNLLPPEQAYAFERFNQFAPFVLILLIVTGIFWRIIGPIIVSLAGMLLGW